MTPPDYTDLDREIWERELENFVPPLIYDMHTHMWSEAHRGSLDSPPGGLRLEIDYREGRRTARWCFG